VNEYASLIRRFWIAVAVSVVLAALAVSRDYVGGHVFSGVWIARLRWVELALATFALLWCGRLFFARLLARKPDAPAIALVAAAAIYCYGTLAVLVPGIWPREWRDAHGMVGMRFELISGAVALALLFELSRIGRRGPAPR